MVPLFLVKAFDGSQAVSLRTEPYLPLCVQNLSLSWFNVCNELISCLGWQSIAPSNLGSWRHPLLPSLSCFLALPFGCLGPIGCSGFHSMDWLTYGWYSFPLALGFVFLCFSECHHHELSYGNNVCSINVNCFSHPKHHSMDAFFFVFFVFIGLSYLFFFFFHHHCGNFEEEGDKNYGQSTTINQKFTLTSWS